MSAARAGVKPAESEPGDARYVAPADRAGRDLWAELADPFPADELELLPKPTKKENPPGACTRPDRNGLKCGGYHGLPAIHLHYVGHAGVTGRLNSVDPTWTWEPAYREIHPEVMKVAVQTGDAAIIRQVLESSPMQMSHGGLWIKLTIPALGVTRLGFGDAQGKTGPNATKEIIGDALRNAAMRFGVGLYLWSKSDAAAAMLERGEAPEQAEPPRPPAPRAPEPPAAPQEDVNVERDRAELLEELGRVCEQYKLDRNTVVARWRAHHDGARISETTDLMGLTEFVEDVRRGAAMDASKAGARS